jgi:hypothetical protein
MYSDPSSKPLADAVYPPTDCIKLWRTNRGWSVFFPDGTPPAAIAEIEAAISRLAHQVP